MAIDDIGTDRARWKPKSAQPTPMCRWRVWQTSPMRAVLTGWISQIDAALFARKVGGEVEEGALTECLTSS